MFTLTGFQAAAVAVGLLAVILLLVGGVLVAFPRGTHRVAATVSCPLFHRRARVELLRDAWTLRAVDVARCSLLSEYSSVICGRQCLAGRATVTRARAA
jgi:hypothetical protein